MSSPEPRVLRGGCLCGAVAYEVEDAFRYAAELPLLAVPARDRLGLQAVRRHRAARSTASRRARTGCCATATRRRATTSAAPPAARCSGASCARTPGSTSTYGTLLDPPSLPIQGHIMVGSKAPWHTITDDLAQAEEF